MKKTNIEYRLKDIAVIPVKLAPACGKQGTGIQSLKTGCRIPEQSGSSLHYDKCEITTEFVS